MSRSDHPRLFADRIDARALHLNASPVTIPTFEEWEERELPDLLKSGPAMVVEDPAGEHLGLVRLYKMNLRDGWAYLDFRLRPDIEDAPLMETYVALADYAFSNFNLRKVYGETISLNQLALDWYRKFGFEEEVRLREYVWHGGEHVDLISVSLERTTWEALRERFLATLDVARAAETLSS